MRGLHHRFSPSILCFPNFPSVLRSTYWWSLHLPLKKSPRACNSISICQHCHRLRASPICAQPCPRQRHNVSEINLHGF
uniref:Uncharacterized protein n=1 Tax=Arundo donax TaxID=35708 RepID=A0A0A9H518_ARUDO